MLDPFDSEFLSQELRDSWKKIQELEEENKGLKEELEFYKERDRQDYYDEEFSDHDWGRE